MRRTHSPSDMEDAYDELQPCFFKNDYEQFYDDPAPSEDIWKKFELLTPPRSPRHEGDDSLLVPTGLLDLERVTYLLSDDVSKTRLDWSSLDSQAGSPSCSDDDEEIQKAVIQDCMWSGLHVPKDLSVNNKLECLIPKTNSVAPGMDITTSDCVDPTAVFPYPLSNKQEEAHNLGMETPSDSEADEEEEIDVVTVAEKCQQRQKSTCLPGAASMSAQVAAMHNYTQPCTAAPPPQRTRASNQNVACKRPRHSATGDTGGGHPPIKKLRISLPNGDLRSVVQKLKLNNSSNSRPNSRNSSDSEDCEGRRAQHNVLERKRRNDLKSSFFRLRDLIPALNAQERAAKVVILRKATDFILDLRSEEQTLMNELEHQKQIQERLKKRLASLQRR